MNNKLEVKDLINVGLFSALYIVCFFATAMLGYIPIFMALLPLICPIIAGIPFMLFTTKVKKFGMVTLTGIIVSLLMFAMGHPWYIVLFGIVFGFAGDLIMKSGNYASKKLDAIGYAVLSEWCLGAVVSMFFGFRDSYFKSMRAGYGDVYVDKVMALTPDWMFYALAVMAIIGGLIGAYIGQKVLRKHFKKAGIV